MQGPEGRLACGCLPAADAGWSPNLTWITADLAVGGRFPAERALHLASSAGVAAVIDLRDEHRHDEAHLAAHGIALLHLPTEDHGALAPADLAQGVAFARRAAGLGGRLLVHCEHGIGRSATLALCILADRGHAPLEALRLAKDRRAVLSPSPAQYECWTAWLRDRPEIRSGLWTVPDFDAFRAIAYRHLAAG